MYNLKKWDGSALVDVFSVDDTTGVKFGASGSGLVELRKYDVVFDPGSVAANTSEEETATVTGVAVGDVVLAVVKPTAFNAGLGIVGARVSAANTVIVTFMNTSAGAIDAGSETYTFVVARFG